MAGQTGRVYRDFIHPDNMPISPTSLIEFRVTGIEGPRALTFTRRELRRFLECPTPRRAEWTGDKTRYTAVLELARVMGWVTDAGAGVKWANGWQSLGRRVMALTDRHDVRLSG
mgnify:FL=1